LFTWKNLNRLFFLATCLLVAVLIWIYRYSIPRVVSLSYPTSQHAFYLDEQIDLKNESGAYAYGLGPGAYVEVLTNDKGSFYLSPPMGFFIFGARGNHGFGVGGIYVPADADGEYHIWQYGLKNEHRNMEQPRVDRMLSPDHDQPERVMFLDPKWYENKSFSLSGWPLIDPKIKISASAFRSIPLEKVPDLLVNSYE